MSLNRREFILTATATAVGTTAAVEHTKPDEGPVSLGVDLDRMHMESGGKDLYANIYAVSEEENLDRLGVEVLEPENDDWKVLEQIEASGNSVSLEESYHPEVSGTHSFRAVAYTDDTQYVSAAEDVEVF